MLTLPKLCIQSQCEGIVDYFTLVWRDPMDDFAAVVRILPQNVRGLSAYQMITFLFPTEGVQ